MTSSDLSDLQNITVFTATDLANFWGTLLRSGRIARRTLWLAVLDDYGRPVPVAMPIDHLPHVASEGHLEGLKTVITGMGEHGVVVMLIARPGADVVGEDDRRWADALTPFAPSWPVHLATGSGGRSWIQPILLTT